MEMVIKISEENREKIKHAKQGIFIDLYGIMETAINNGTPLPKGHGDLIDRKALVDNGINKGFCDWYDEIKYANTVIDADKEDKEEK